MPNDESLMLQEAAASMQGGQQAVGNSQQRGWCKNFDSKKWLKQILITESIIILNSNF